MQRMPVLRDDQSFRDRTERMFREMQEKMGFHGINDPLMMDSSSWPSVSPADSWSTAYNNPRFFELWPTTASPAVSAGQPQQQQVAQSYVNGTQQQQQQQQFEVLDDATMRSLFFDLDPEQGRGQGRLFRMSFDLRQYASADIAVRTENETCLVVEAKHSDENATGGSKVSRQFCRRIQLPTGVDPSKLTSTLSADGILTVQAPVPPQYQAVVGSGTGTGAGLLQQQQQQQQQLQAPVQGLSSGGRVSPRLGLVPVVQAMPALSASFDMPTFGVDAATGRRRLDLVVDLGSTQFSADDVAVRLDGRRLTVEARREISDRPGRVSTSSTQKQYDLGEDVDPATIKASLGADGRLAIFAFVK